MITQSNQSWNVGKDVNVGFMRGLRVIAKVPTPGDYAPDEYILSRAGRFYSFVPHKGITRVDATYLIERM